jgi:hypothetical protein
MKKLLVLITIIALAFTGCATSNYCKDQAQTNAAVAYIHSALRIVQVGYPFVAELAGIGATSPLVMGAVSTIDNSLQGLGELAYNILCPGVAEMRKADALLAQAQEAKAILGVK